MNYRLSTVLSRKAISADTVETIDVDIIDPITQLVIAYEATSTASSPGTGHPARCITKIELVDGSDVLVSLSGVEAHAMDWYHTGREPANQMLYLNGNNAESILNLNFGRYLYDPLLALDPKKFTNLQLKISIDVSAGAVAPTAGFLTVSALLFDQKPIVPIGFLMQKEIKSYAMGAGTHEYTDLPLDYPYRKILIKAQKYGTGPEYSLSNIKLSEDADKKVPINQSIGEILRTIVSQMRPYREKIVGGGTTTAANFYCTPGYWPLFAAAQWRSACVDQQVAIYSGDGGRFTVACTSAGPNWQALVEGHCPHNAIAINFGLQNEIDDWFDISRLGNLKLDITAGSGMSSSETCEIFIQQLRRY